MQAQTVVDLAHKHGVTLDGGRTAENLFDHASYEDLDEFLKGAMVRPDLMTPFWVFLLGVLEDFLSGGPPGVWAASFLAAYFLIDRQRDMLAGLSGLGAIIGFAVSALV